MRLAAVTFGCLLCTLAGFAPALADGAAGVLRITGTAGGGAILLVPGAGGSAAGMPGPLLPIPGAPSTAPVSAAAPLFVAPSAGNGAAQGDAGGVDQRWGDPLSAHVIDEDGLQGGFNYFYGSSLGGNEGGVGFSLTFKN